jgi:hypothetical protein
VYDLAPDVMQCDHAQIEGALAPRCESRQGALDPALAKRARSREVSARAAGDEGDGRTRSRRAVSLDIGLADLVERAISAYDREQRAAPLDGLTGERRRLAALTRLQDVV